MYWCQCFNKLRRLGRTVHKPVLRVWRAGSCRFFLKSGRSLFSGWYWFKVNWFSWALRSRCRLLKRIEKHSMMDPPGLFFFFHLWFEDHISGDRSVSFECLHLQRPSSTDSSSRNSFHYQMVDLLCPMWYTYNSQLVIVVQNGMCSLVDGWDMKPGRLFCLDNRWYFSI